ncbi:MAG: prepilin-type N-terminal cleavage/methylation domain-containing protein [Pseudomonadota bacterium]
MSRLNSRAFQRGLTLIELMIGMAIGLIVVGMVLSVYLTTLRTSGDTIKSSRLNQEIAAIMNIMVNDIRRAGYALASGPDWDNPDPVTGLIDPDDYDNLLEPSTNPFNQLGSTALEVHNAADDDQGSQGSGSCIVYAYDANIDGDLDDNESFGFRLNATGDAIQMRQSIDSAAGDVSNSCDNANDTWATLNDEESVTITGLTFALLDSSCINTLEPDEVDNDGAGGVDDWGERDCYTIDPADYRATYPADESIPVVEVRNVLITLNAQLIDDTDVSITLQQHVTIRNNLVRLIP